MIAEEQKNKIIVSFHTGRGGRFHNSGYKKYLGEKSFKEIITENENNIFVKNRDENGKYIKPIIIDGSGNEISDNKINDEIGILNFDHDYDTTVSKYIEQCTNEEIELIKKSEIYKSEEINEYIKAHHYEDN